MIRAVPITSEQHDVVEKLGMALMRQGSYDSATVLMSIALAWKGAPITSVGDEPAASESYASLLTELTSIAKGENNVIDFPRILGEGAVRLKREILKDAPLNSIVRCKGEWGVVVKGTHRPRWRTIDFWAGGRRHIPDISEVDVLVEKGRAL